MSHIMTVRGSVDSVDLGPTLPHEHIFVNLMKEFRATGLLNDYSLMVDEVRRFVQAGGATIVDVTPPELTHGASPDPAGSFSGVRTDSLGPSTRDVSNLLAIQRLSVEAGVNVVVGTGHYRDPYLDRHWFAERSVSAIADLLIRDHKEGMCGTGIRPGIIGEIGSNQWYISETEERSFRAAARAQHATGLTITTHANRWPVGLAQLDLLESEGVDPRRVIIGHCDSVNVKGYPEALARRGAFVQFDHCRVTSVRDSELSVSMVMDLVRAGFAEQVLLSSDVCLTPHLYANGGGGFAYVPTTFKEGLLAAGLSEDAFQRIHVDNPRRALTGEDLVPSRD